MVRIHCLIFGLLCAVLGQQHAPCVDYSSVCVPAAAMQRGCHCALIRPGQEVSARESLRQMFGRRKRDAFDDIRFSILSQNGVNELNRFFPAVYSTPLALDNWVYAFINYKVHTSLMTVSKGMVAEVLNMQTAYLSHDVRHHLLHCGNPAHCEVDFSSMDLQPNGSPRRQHRKFLAMKAIRYDMEDDTTLLAFSTAESDFHLNKWLNKFWEKDCTRILFFFKTCEMVYRQRWEFREFTEPEMHIWMHFVNRHMVGSFRIHNANMLA